MTKERAVIESLLSGMKNERWLPGTRLPGEIAQARKFCVSRVTIRRALERLEQHGLIERRQGGGTYFLRAASKEQIDSIIGGVARLRVSAQHRVVSKPIYRLVFYTSRSVDHLYTDIHAGLMAQAEERGHTILTGSSIKSLEAVMHEFQGVDGLVLFDLDVRDKDLPNLAKIPCPYVLLGNRPLHNVLRLDWKTMSQQALEALVRAGHQNVAILEKDWDPERPPLHKYDFQDMKRRILDLHVIHHYSTDPLEQLMPMLSDVTGLFITDDVYAVEVCRRLTEAGCAPGKDIHVISQSSRGFDPGLPPEIDRMEFDITEWGSMAVQMLERLLDRNEKIFPPMGIAAKFIASDAG